MEAPRPATAEQVHRARNGRFHHVGGEVERALQDYEPNLRIRYSDTGGYYVVYYLDPATGDEDLVTTALDYDMRIVAKVMAIDSERYDLVAEMDRLDAQAERDLAHIESERVGEVGQRLHHAFRKDLGDTGSIFVPKGI
jgi:hypothetical protein